MRILLIAGLALGLSAGFASAGTPFGGDDTGFVPPSEPLLTCSSKVTAAIAKLRERITRCHIQMANARLHGNSSADDEGCETQAKAKFDAAVMKTFYNGCPPCLVAATSGLGDSIEAELDASNVRIYCNGIHPFGGDDTGSVPLNSLYFKAQRRAGRNVAKLGICITKCHTRLAASALGGGSFDEEGCEAFCLQRYDLERDLIVPSSPDCLQRAEHDQLAADTEAELDQELGNYYCASPSGAFVDPR